MVPKEGPVPITTRNSSVSPSASVAGSVPTLAAVDLTSMVTSLALGARLVVPPLLLELLELLELPDPPPPPQAPRATDAATNNANLSLEQVFIQWRQIIQALKKVQRPEDAVL